MDPVEIRKKRKAEWMAQLKELKSELKKLEEQRSMVTDPNKPSQIEKLSPFLAMVAKKQRAALREEYSNREPLILRLNSQQHPCCTAASPPAFSEDGEGKEA